MHTLQRLHKLLLAAGSTTAFAFAPLLVVAAEHREPNVSQVPLPRQLPPSANAVEQLRLSDRLADYGERNGDALALITAAKIRKVLPASLTAVSPGATDARSWSALLKRATQLAAGDRNVLGLIEDVRKLKGRDIPGIDDDVHLLREVVKGNGVVRFNANFKANEVAIVYAEPETTGDISLSVYDENINLICRGSATTEPVCRWRPRWDGKYFLDVSNPGTTDVAYRLAINRETVAH